MKRRGPVAGEVYCDKTYDSECQHSALTDALPDDLAAYYLYIPLQYLVTVWHYGEGWLAGVRGQRGRPRCHLGPGPSRTFSHAIAPLRERTR